MLEKTKKIFLTEINKRAIVEYDLTDLIDIVTKAQNFQGLYLTLHLYYVQHNGPIKIEALKLLQNPYFQADVQEEQSKKDSRGNLVYQVQLQHDVSMAILKAAPKDVLEKINKAIIAYISHNKDWFENDPTRMRLRGSLLSTCKYKPEEIDSKPSSI